MGRVSPDFDTTRFDEDTPSTHFIGAEVYSFDGLPEGMTAKTLRGGGYAVFTHKGKVDALKRHMIIFGEPGFCIRARKLTVGMILNL